MGTNHAFKYVTPDQIAKARQVGTLEYIQRYEPEELTRTYLANGKTMRCKAGEFRTKTHDSLSINGNWFFWWSRGVGGSSALDYLTKVKEMPFQDAVQLLTEDSTLQTSQSTATVHLPESQPEKQKTLRLPRENTDNRRVFAYLSKTRGIDPEIINHCLKHRILYEDADHHNAVFIGYEGRKPRFGSLRSTITDSKWRMDLPGSDKRYSFCMDQPNATRVMVFEAPIDAMSMASLLKMQGKDWRSLSYLSLGGTASVALLHYLSCHPAISQATIALDNDEPGQRNAQTIRQAVLCDFPEIRVNVIYPSPEQGKDWNDVLRFKRQQEQQSMSLTQQLTAARDSVMRQNTGQESYLSKKMEVHL